MVFQPLLGRSQLRTGRRKRNADDCGFVQGIQVYVTISNVSMMLSGKNIPATDILYATVAPILHIQVHAEPADRGTTLNNGAAA